MHRMVTKIVVTKIVVSKMIVAFVPKTIALVCFLVIPTVYGQDVAKEAKEEAKSTRRPDVIFVPTPNDVVEKMLELAEPKKTDVIYDLGCGDGRIVVAAAKKYGCRAVGYDIDPKRVSESQKNVEKNQMEKLVRIEQRDIFTLDLSPARVVTLYLLPELNVRLIPQLEKLKPGSRIVSHDFRMRGVKPDRVVKLKSKEDGADHKVFLWTTPLKKRQQEPQGDEASATGLPRS